MTCGVYAYQDNIYNKIVYIGASKDCERRNQNHYAPSVMKKQYINYILQNDIDNRYSFIILLECSEKDLYEKESAFIKMIKPEYNYKSIRDLGIKERIAVSDTQTGFYHVSKTKTSYSYRIEFNGKKYSFYNSSIRDLEYNVLQEGLLWFMTNIENAKRTLFESDNKKNNTMYYNVRKVKSGNKQGFVFKYKKDDTVLTSMYIEELEYKVKKLNLPWRAF